MHRFKSANFAIFRFCQNGTNALSKRLGPNCESSCVPQHHMVVFRGKSRVQPPCCHLGSSNQYCMTHFSMRLALQRDARGVCGVPYLLLYVRACGLSPKHGIAALFKALHSRIKWTCVWSCKLINGLANKCLCDICFWQRFYIVVLGIVFFFFLTSHLLFPYSFWTFIQL